MTKSIDAITGELKERILQGVRASRYAFAVADLEVRTHFDEETLGRWACENALTYYHELTTDEYLFSVSPSLSAMRGAERGLKNFVDQINQDLQISTPAKLFDPSPFEKVASALSGITAGFVNPFPFSELHKNAIRREQFVAEIATLANVSVHEAIDFCDSSGYTFEFIKEALQAGAKLDEEDIKRTMEERIGYFTKLEPPHTFIITTPTNDRITVKAADCSFDGGCLYLLDDFDKTIYAVAAGHWVKVERVEEDDPSS